jgi:transposase-like protein
MAFQPRHCPHAPCPSRLHQRTVLWRPFLWCRRGHFRRKCDGRVVPRFRCLTCRRGFSSQTFRLDYRLRLPALHLDVFRMLVSKVSLRQAARVLGTRRRTVEHRQLLLGRHARAFQLRELARRGPGALPAGVYLLDEMETFERSRRVEPLTVPVLVERESGFVVDVQVGTLPCRGRLSAREERRKRELEARHGKRRSQSSAVVRACLRTLAKHATQPGVVLKTDCKATYPALIRAELGSRVGHERTPSSVKKSVRHPLFKLHVAQAMLRDGLSRMVRRNWSHSKVRRRLRVANWIWVAWKNWIRYSTNEDRKRSPAMVLGLAGGRWAIAEFFRWRVFEGVIA